MNLLAYAIYNKKILAIILGTVFLVACGKPTPTPGGKPTPYVDSFTSQMNSSLTPVASTSSAMPPIPAPTQQPFATPVEPIMQDPKPTATPVSPLGGFLNAEGPWLLYSLGPDRNEWYVVNPDGSGRSLLAPESSGTPHVPLHSDKNHVAFRSSNQITIYKLPSLELVASIPFQLNADILHPDSLDLLQTQDPVFSENPLWSPNGRYFAFTAAIESPIMDVYIFDTESKLVQRLTYNPDSASLIDWSPDSNWLVYQTSACNEEEPDVDPDICWDVDFVTRAVSLSGSNRKLYEPGFGTWSVTWTSQHSFFSSESTLNLAAHTIRYVDLETGEVSIPFRGWWASPTTYDPIANFLVVPHQPTVVPEELRTTGRKAGLYVLTPGSQEPHMVDTSPIGDDFSLKVMDLNLMWSETLNRVVLMGIPCNGDEKAIPAIHKDGTIKCLPWEPSPESDILHWSPDGRWAINIQGTPKLLDSEGQVIFKLPWGSVYDVLWGPDSLGVFLTSGKYLFYLSTTEPNPIVVDGRYPHSYSHYTRPFIWIGVK